MPANAQAAMLYAAVTIGLHWLKLHETSTSGFCVIGWTLLAAHRLASSKTLAAQTDVHVCLLVDIILLLCAV